MHSNIATLLSMSPIALALVVPNAIRQTPSANDSIVGAANTVAILAADYIARDAPLAKAEWDTTHTNFDQIASEVLSPGDVCQTPQGPSNVNSLSSAMTALNDTEIFLGRLLAALPNDDAHNAVVVNFCGANLSFAAVENYTFNTLGKVEENTNLTIGETYAQLALNALQSALSVIPDGSPATGPAKFAYNSSIEALTTFADLANVPNGYAGTCPPATRPAANGSANAEYYTSDAREFVVPHAYLDTVNQGQYNLDDFCEINDYMIAIDHYVQSGDSIGA